ncbi:LTA synthase family protein [Ligilactobacillus faecis]|uniref:LTA synthase family protein n=1 Tax=Ligilactobacillus faecis TaxID=762833 RepID=UPI00246849AE|nr:LTA synthase family protein [Ligilactobacillus faecis]WGN89663.1 LTA synthase family protein [Ligilactobacillus faecis]
MNWTKLRNFLNTRWGFFALVTFLFWAKTILVYLIDFNLGVHGIYQYFVLLINPIATTMLLFSIALYIKRTIPAYLCLLLLYIANTAFLLISVIYYREFTDFMTTNVIFGYSSVSQGLSGSSFSLLKPQDFLIVGDVVLVLLLLLTRQIKLDPQPIEKKQAVAMTSFSLMFLLLNVTLGEIDRPQLLTRTFDRNYLVKYLGIDAFTVYDGLKTAKTSQTRSKATGSDLNKIIDFTQKNYAAPDPKMFGIAKNKNIIVLHLESFQQFLIDYKLNDQEVTPFLNSLYHGKETYSFANFFNQVGQGKTSDAETMLETGTYGLPQGSLFSTLGTDNTFEAMPAILNQSQNYSSAVFHGNAGSFWNRDKVYKNFGYQYFFDASYYDQNAANLTEYGLKDKLLFHDSVKYLEKLQQPFYAKFITVSNHFPFVLDEQNKSFETANTGDSSVDNYFVTAHYLDQAVKEFFDYLKASGLYDNSVIVLYGDHYGISNSRNLKLASLLGRSASTWSDFDNAQLQRVPFMVHIPGQENGRISEQYGGEIDVMPTLLHLLGIDSKKYLLFGTDLFSPQHNQTVAFRNENFITPNYTVIGNTIYENSTGNVVTHPSKKVQTELKQAKEHVGNALSLSDALNNKNLLRFYVPTDFKPVDPRDYNYKNEVAKLDKIQEKLKERSTSLWSKNNGHSTVDKYQTDAPELHKDETQTDEESSSTQPQTTSSTLEDEQQ